MLNKILKQDMGTSNLGWLESRFHFSFAEYHNPSNIHFGVLRVLNDDIVHPKSGFDTHPHKNMEIISYIVDGEITHKDSMGNEEILRTGEVQYMSAGTGITHSEYNNHEKNDLRLLQIWIFPPKKGLTPIYGSYRFEQDQYKNRLLNIVSDQKGNAKVKIHQDVKIYASRLEKTKDLVFDITLNRQIYFIQIEGSSTINDTNLNHGDAMEIVDESNLNIKALDDSHFLFIEMPKG